MKFRRSILTGVGGVALGAALIAFGLAWDAGSSHAQTPSTTPTTAAGSVTPVTTGTAVSTPTTAVSPLTPVVTPTGAVAGAETLPGTGTGFGTDSGSTAVLWIGIGVLATGLAASALSLTAKRRRS